MLYHIIGYCLICDGWRDTGGENQYHMNYGWDYGAFNGWYTVDHIYGSPDPMEEYLRSCNEISVAT